LSERRAYLQPPVTGEQRLVVGFVVLSIAAHIIAFSIEGFGFLRTKLPPVVEWEMEADLIADFDFASSKETVIPDAKVDEEIGVPDTMLPQLTKTFSVVEDQVPEALEGEEPAPTPDAQELVKDKSDINLNADRDKSNRLAKQEALKRMHLERLREKNKDKELKTTRDDALASIRDQLAMNDRLSAKRHAGVGDSAIKQYRSSLQQAVRRQYTLPEAYNMQNANLLVVISITVNERGDLMSSSIEQSSGDRVFDDLAFAAVRRAAPLPRPPPGQAGEVIFLQFSPRNL